MEDLIYDLEPNDIVLLNSGRKIKIEENQYKEPFSGEDVASGNNFIFAKNDIKVIKKHGLKCHADNVNFWVFNGISQVYCPFWIAQWAKFEKPDIFDNLSISEICDKHIYQFDESNPETQAKYYCDEGGFVLYNQFKLLSKEMKVDAKL